MSVDEDVSADSNAAKELTPEEAKKKREHFLALAAKNARLNETDADEVDSADSTMATLILPGG
jgi:hypothetical protein